jgi:tetratricopeptide (TPR) repeat protein
MIKTASSRTFTAVVSILLYGALAGCVSTEKRFRKGQALESQGRLEEASQRYIAVLAKEPGREDARRSLEDVGARLIEDWLGRARADGDDGRFEEAVSAIRHIDGFRDRAGQVGVTFAVPEDYRDFRRRMTDAAVAALLRQAEELEHAGNWPGAVERYDRLRAYALSPEETLRIDEARVRVLLRWAEDDMSRGAFRAAYGRAQSALALVPSGGDAAAAARSLQKAALDAGTKTVAVLPFWVGPGAGPGLPRGLEDRLYDAFVFERLDKPVPFVGPIDRGSIHREMDRRRVRDGDIPDRTAAAIGLALRADFVVVGWLDRFRQEDGVAQETPRKAPLRRDRTVSATYTERRFTAKLTGEFVYRIIDPVTRKTVDEETVSAEVSAPFRRAAFDGDPATLDLSREERALFDREAWRRAEEELEDELVDKLAEKIASGLFERVLRDVR